MNNIFVEIWERKSIEYDLAIAALGYESRAPYASKELDLKARAKVAVAFDPTTVYAYESNLEIFHNLGFIVEQCQDSTCTDLIRESLASASSEALRVLVDVSSFNRVRLAQIVELLCKEARSRRIHADFVYTVGHAGESLDHGPIRRIGPVTPFFAGWSPSADLPPAAIFGVGYEQEKAIGCLENLEAFTSWAFRTCQDGSGNYENVTDANKLLWQTVPEDSVIEYALDDPVGTITTLEAVVYGALQTYRPVLIPFGPKIFYLSNLLVAAAHYPSVSVWRAELIKPEQPQDRLPKRILGLATVFGGARD